MNDSNLHHESVDLIRLSAAARAARRTWKLVPLEPEPDSGLVVKEANLLFHTEYPRVDSAWTRDFDYSPRRGQFLLLGPESGLEQSSVNVRVNWFTDLEHLQ